MCAFLVATIKKGPYWEIVGEGKSDHLSQYHRFIGMRGHIGGLLEMLLCYFGGFCIHD
jgi:hypothetical protein